MPTCACPGQELVGSAKGFNGWGQGQTEQIAIQNAYRNSNLVDVYVSFMVLAMNYECEGDCYISTGFSIDPPPNVKKNPKTGLFEATLTNADLRVWVICSRHKTGKIKID